MKKIILLICVIVICGCNKTEVVSEEYLRDKGIHNFCNGYTAIGIDYTYVDVYKNTSGSNYEKIFTAQDFQYNVLFTNDDIFLYAGGENGSDIIGYDLNGNHVRKFFNSLERDLNLHTLYGAKDGYLYLKFFSLDNKPKYGKIDTDLKFLEMINYDDIPKAFDFLECDSLNY